MLLGHERPDRRAPGRCAGQACAACSSAWNGEEGHRCRRVITAPPGFRVPAAWGRTRVRRPIARYGSAAGRATGGVEAAQSQQHDRLGDPLGHDVRAALAAEAAELAG